jgi:predicted DCC family thiol-disulfide oxidoreductase YuxK
VTRSEPDGRDWVLWDGDCGFCRRSAAWIARHDRAGHFRIVPYQDAPSPPMTPALRAAAAQAVHVVTSDGRVLRAGRACLHILDRLGWSRLVRVLRVPPLVWAVEVGYALVAGNRRTMSRLLRVRDRIVSRLP